MATIGTLAYKIVANTSGFSRGIVATQSELSKLKRTFADAQGPVAKFSQQFDRLRAMRMGGLDPRLYAAGMRQIGKEALSAIPGMSVLTSKMTAMFGGAAVAGGSLWAVKLAADAEQAQQAFTVMLGSGEKARQLMGQLQSFAVQSPFSLADVRQGARVLLAYGVDAQQLMPIMSMLGDVSAGTGKNFAELSVIFGQIKSAGRLMGQDLLQLSQAGIPMIATLSKQFGVSEAEIRKMVEAGSIGFNDVVQAFRTMTGEGGLFFNMMDVQSQTLVGRWNALTESATLLAMQIGEAFMPAAKQVVEWLIQAVEWFKNLDGGTVRMVAVFGSAIVAFGLGVNVIGKVITAVNLLVTAYKALTMAQVASLAFSGKKGLAQLAAGAAAAAAAGVGVSIMFDSWAQTSDAATLNMADLKKQVAALDVGGAKGPTAKEIKAQEKIAKTQDKLAEQKRKAEAKRIAESIEAAGKQFDEIKQRGDQMRDSLRTPGEEFRDAMVEINALSAAGAIDDVTRLRAIAAEKKKLAQGLGEDKLPELLEAGTQAAFASDRAGLIADKTDDVIKLAEDQLAAQEVANKFLEDMNNGLKSYAAQIIINEIDF